MIDFMELNIHPSAESNFNSKAEELLLCIQKVPPSQYHGKQFFSDIHVAATITDEEIIGEIQESTGDYRGKTLERFFPTIKRDMESFQMII
jgi:hypothetical protein